MSTSNAVIEATLTVTNGPSAADLVNSLLYAYSPRKLPVAFTADTVVAGEAIRGMEFEASIIGISYESGSPGMLIVDLYITKGYDGRGSRCHGFYNANTRSGTLSLGLLP